MADIHLLHSGSDFYAIQNNVSWNAMSRVDRKIFFLCQERNSYKDIAYLLKIDAAFVRNRMCFFYVSGYVQLYIRKKIAINAEIIKHSAELLQPYYQLCIRKLHDLLSENLTVKYIEAQFITCFHFIVRVAAQTDKSVIDSVRMFATQYHICEREESDIDRMIDCFLKAFAYCLQFEWTEEVEEAWRRLCHVLKYALLSLCQ